MIGAYAALACASYFLPDFEAARQYAMRGVQIWRSGCVPSHPEDVDTPVEFGLGLSAVFERRLAGLSLIAVYDGAR